MKTVRIQGRNYIRKGKDCVAAKVAINDHVSITSSNPATIERLTRAKVDKGAALAA